MPSLISASFIWTMFTSTSYYIFSYFFDSPRTPPRVPSLLFGYDNGLMYALNPCSFLARCQERYGPVFSLSLGYWQLKVVSSGDAISSVFSTSPQLLRNDIMHREMFYVVSGVKSNYTHLHEVMIRELFPLVDKRLSPRLLGQSTQGFGLILLSEIKSFLQDHSGPISLTSLTNEPLYNTTNLVLLGSAFPGGTYKDFRTLNQSIPYRLCRTLLWRGPSNAARARLLNHLEGYLRQGEVMDCDDQFCRGFTKVFEKNGIQSLEGAQLVLNFLWGVHSNTLSNSLFLLSFLLGDPCAFARVRAEIDSAVEKFGGMEVLLEAGADKLDDPSFKLLTSAVMETLRLTGLHAGVRQASCDFDLRVRDGTIPIKKGEFVFGNVRAAHMDVASFPNPEAFVVDRFGQCPYQRRHLQTGGHLFHSLGGGRHVCKGRWLAVYAIKVLIVILVHKFDFLPTGENAANWCSLRAHPRSIGIVHTEDDVLVRVIPRGEDGVLSG